LIPHLWTEEQIIIEDKGRSGIMKKISGSMTKSRKDPPKPLKRGDVHVYGDFSPYAGDQLTSPQVATSVHNDGRRPTKENLTRKSSFGVRGRDVGKQVEELCELLGVEFNDGLGIPVDLWEAQKSPISSQPVSPIGAPCSSTYSSSDGDDFRFDLQPTSFDLSSTFASPILSPVTSPVMSPVMSPGRYTGKEHEKQLSPAPRQSTPPLDIPQKPIDHPQKTADHFHPSSGSAFQHLKETSNSCRPKSLEGDSESGKHAKEGVKAEVLAGDGSGVRVVKDSLTMEVRLPPLLVGPVHTDVGDVSVKDSARSPSQRSIRWHTRSPPPVEAINLNSVPALSNALDSAQQPLTEPFLDVSPVDDTADVVPGIDSKPESDFTFVVPKVKLPHVQQKNLSFCCEWRKGDLLGSGSFGTVYEGLGNNGCFFAVKEVSLLDEGRQAKQAILQLQQEITLLSELKHENIVQYLGTQRTEDKLYIFLELVSKGSLASLYKRYPMVEEQVRAYTHQILHGLKYLHDRNIIHRDIKCANLLVDVNGVVKLADFGMAKELDKLGKLKSVKGSPYWMAPEVIDCTKTYGIAADIWSLGCTVLEMVTGKPPLSELDWPVVVWRVGHGEAPPIPENLSVDLKDFIKQCLEVDVNKRPTVDILLHHPLVCSKPISGPFKLIAMAELSTIAEDKSFHSSTTGNTDPAGGEVKNHTEDGVLRVVRGRQGRSMRTIRNDLSMSSNSY
jgi:serine/threonine protein kinase